MKKKETLLLAAVVILSVILRFWKLGSIPNGLYWDEIAMLVDAKTIAANGHDMHGNPAVQAMFPSYGDYKLPVYIWFAATSVKIFGVSAFALRLPSAIVGVFQSVIILLLMRELLFCQNLRKHSFILSLTGALFLAVSPWSFLFSRTGFEGHVGQFFLNLAVLGLFLSKRKKYFILLSVFSSIIAVYSYYSVRFVWPVVLLAFWATQICVPFIQSLYKGEKKHTYIPTFFSSSILLFVCMFLWALSLIPLFTSPYYRDSQQFRLSTDSLLTVGPFIQQSNEYRQIAGNTLVSRVLYHHRILQLRALATNYAKNLDFSYLFLYGDPNLRHSTKHHGLFLLFTFPFLIGGSIYLLKNNRSILVFLLIWWLIALLPAAVPLNTPHALRSLNALSPIVLLMCFGAAASTRIPIFKKNSPIRSISFALLGLVLCAEILSFAADYFVLYPKESAESWQQGYAQIVETIQPKFDKVDTVWINIEDDRFYLWYLAFGPLSASEIQKLPYEKYFLHDAGKVKFHPFIWKGYDTQVKPFLVVSRAGQLEKNTDSVTTISDPYGNPKFQIGYYEK